VAAWDADKRGGCAARGLVQNCRVKAKRSIWNILKGATENWLEDQASSISAALAFYCAFSLAPLLIIIIAITGWIVGGEVAQSFVGSQLTMLFGRQSAELILEAMRGAQTADGMLATIVSVLMLVISARASFPSASSSRSDSCCWCL
jgi:membrane protein